MKGRSCVMNKILYNSYDLLIFQNKYTIKLCRGFDDNLLISSPLTPTNAASQEYAEQKDFDEVHFTYISLHTVIFACFQNNYDTT